MSLIKSSLMILGGYRRNNVFNAKLAHLLHLTLLYERNIYLLVPKK